jgi:hypothetical protein
MNFGTELDKSFFIQEEFLSRIYDSKAEFLNVLDVVFKGRMIIVGCPVRW